MRQKGGGVMINKFTPDEIKDLVRELSIRPLPAEDGPYTRTDAIVTIQEQLERRPDELVVRFFVLCVTEHGRDTDGDKASRLLQALRANFEGVDGGMSDANVMGKWYFIRIALEHISLELLERLTGYSAEAEAQLNALVKGIQKGRIRVNANGELW
jgi:hypothetical protein